MDLGSYREPSASYKELASEEAAMDLLQVWDNNGEVHDIPGLSELPADLRDLFLKYKGIFSTSLTEERKMNCEPVKISLRDGEALLDHV